MSNYEKFNLKLLGRNQEDLKVISAYLQDSIVTIKDIAFLKLNRTFVMVLNRFMWEDIEKGVFRENKRIRCVVKFEEVLNVESKNINQKNKNKKLECLAIESAEIQKGYRIKIFFSGDSIITIATETLEVTLNDVGLPWNVKYAPKHKI